MTVNVEKAKESWDNAGLNEQGQAAIYAWIEQLAKNIESHPGRFDAYAKMAYCSSDVMGSVSLLKDAAEQTSK